MTMLDIREQHPALIEALMTHLAFMQLGFPTEVLFLVPNHHHDSAENRLRVLVILKWQGRQLIVECGMFEHGEEALREQWLAIVAEQNDFPEDTLDELYEKSNVRSCAVDLMIVMHAKGIQHPRRDRSLDERRSAD